MGFKVNTKTLKWFHVWFSSGEMFKNYDALFVKQFITFTHSTNHPAGLILYSLKYGSADGSAYYVSSPITIDTKLKEIFSDYNFTEVAKPDLNLIVYEYGKQLQ